MTNQQLETSFQHASNPFGNMSLTTTSTDTFRVDTVQHETGFSLASLCLSIRFVGNIQSQLQNPPTFIVSQFFLHHLPSVS